MRARLERGTEDSHSGVKQRDHKPRSPLSTNPTMPTAPRLREEGKRPSGLLPFQVCNTEGQQLQDTLTRTSPEHTCAAEAQRETQLGSRDVLHDVNRVANHGGHGRRGSESGLPGWPSLRWSSVSTGRPRLATPPRRKRDSHDRRGRTGPCGKALDQSHGRGQCWSQHRVKLLVQAQRIQPQMVTSRSRLTLATPRTQWSDATHGAHAAS